MTVAYFGKNAGTFFEDDPDNITNGTVASARLFTQTANNQTWLAVQDVAAECFLSDTYGLSPVTNELIVNVLLSPFSQWVDFWFLAMRDGDDDSTLAYEYIQLSSVVGGYRTRTSAIPAGSNSTGKTHWGSIREARWVVFSGTRGDGSENAGLALKLRDNPDPTWLEAQVRIKVSSNKVKLFSGAYQVQSPKGSLTVSI